MNSTVFDISDKAFRRIMRDPKLALPIRWEGGDFKKTLDMLFEYYSQKLFEAQSMDPGGIAQFAIERLQTITQPLTKAVEEYQNGFPAKAYNIFKTLMEHFIDSPFNIYCKSGVLSEREDSLHLYRVAKVEDNKPYGRPRVFHTPFNMRSKVSTCRYSIAGHPSLYLSTSLELSCNEIHADPIRDLILASYYQLDRNSRSSHLTIKVVDLGIKPQDFIEPNDLSADQVDYFEDNHQNSKSKRTNKGRNVFSGLTRQYYIRENYLLWYPLIAACSFIRVNKKDPFAAEYMIPQLVMQWVRSEMSKPHRELIGIRYFSCASIKDSDKGFNYVFPTSGEPVSPDIPYCKVLANAFMLTEPVYVHEYMSVQECEAAIRRMKDRQKIN